MNFGKWLAAVGLAVGLAVGVGAVVALNLAAPPQRIECYDISNTQGTNSVGAMVVFEAGRPKNSEYRRFKIKSVEGPDDFASHQEVLRRRFRAASGKAVQVSASARDEEPAP